MDTGTTSQQQLRLRKPDDVDKSSDASVEGNSAAAVATAVVHDSSLTTGGNGHHKQVKDSQEVPEDIRAFYGHPLTTASQLKNGDGLALLHEYQSLPSIDRTTTNNCTSTNTTITTTTDPSFGTTIGLCSRYDVNSLEFDDAIGQLSGHDLAPHPKPPPASSPTVSMSRTSPSSANFIVSAEFIRGAPLFADDIDAREEAMDSDVERKGQYRDEAFLSSRDNSLRQLNSLPTIILPLSHVNNEDRNNDYEDPTIDELTTVESRDIFPTFEDDQAMSYYETDCNGCETDIRQHVFRGQTTTLPYDLAMSCEVEHGCLEKITDHDGGGGGGGGGSLDDDDDVFCVVTSGELIIDGRKQTEPMLASQEFDHTKMGGTSSRIFEVGDPNEGLPKAEPKPCQNRKSEATEDDGLLAKAPVRRRLAPGTYTTRRRRGMDALPTGGCQQMDYMSYVNSNAQLMKAHLPSYNSSSPTLASSSLLSQPCNYSSSSENVSGGQRGFSGHMASPSYHLSSVNDDELQYLNEDEYQHLVSSDELRMMNLSGDPTTHHDDEAELTAAMTEYRTEQSTDIWQQPFADDFKLASDSSVGCFMQPRDPGGMQWCTISSSDYRQMTPQCSKSTSTIYAIPRTSELGQPSPQNLNFRVPWATPSTTHSPSNAPLDMTSAITNHQNASVALLQSPQSLMRFAVPLSAASGGGGGGLTNADLVAAAHGFRPMTRPPVRRQRRKPTRAHSIGTTESAPLMNPQQKSTDGSGLHSGVKLPLGSGSYPSDVDPTQRQMPGLLPSDRLELPSHEDDQFADPGAMDLGQSNKENSMNSGVEWTPSATPTGIAHSPRLHQLQIHSPIQRRPKMATDTGHIFTGINASSDSIPNHMMSNATGQIQTGHPTPSLDRGSLANIVQNTTTNSASSSLPALPFPLPAVPPGYRLVITHHPLPTENEQEPQHITQLIIDNPSVAYACQASPPTPFVPSTRPYPGNNSQSEATASRDGGRPTRPSTLELLPQATTNQVTSLSVFNSSSADDRAGNGHALGLFTMKTEPPSPLDSNGGHNAPHHPSGVVNQVSRRPNAGPQGTPSSALSPGEDLLEMSMREANVLQLASTRRLSGDRQVFTKRGPTGGQYGQSVVSTPLSSDGSGGGGSGSSRGTPFVDGFPVCDTLLPLNLTGSKSVLSSSSGVPLYPFEVNNNSVVVVPPVGCRGGVIGSSFSGSNTPSAGTLSSDEWSRTWAPGMSASDVDCCAAFQDENLTVMRDNFPVTPEGLPDRMVHRRVSSSSNSSRKVIRSRTPSVRRSRVSIVEKIDPDPSGFEFYLDAPISTNARLDEDRVTYLNKGQYYSLVFMYEPTRESYFVHKNTSLKSVVMVMFRERQSSADEELKAWEFWHSRQHSLKQRVLDIDGKNFGTDGAPISVEEVAYNAVNVVWKSQDKPVKANIAVNCLSTDFSHQKGVKGNPLHIQIDTFADDTDSSILVHRSYCQIKVFCDKGADRKSREEERKRTKGNDSDMVEERHHEPCDRSYFYRMADTTTQPVLFTPTNSISSKTNLKEPSYSLDPVTGERRLGSYLDEDGYPSGPAKRSRSCSYDQQKTPQRILLYAREEADAVFTALMLESQTLASLSNAIYEKYNIPVNSIKNIYNRSRKCVTVKVDDNVVRHFANESTFIIHIEQQQQQQPQPQQHIVDNDRAQDSSGIFYYDVTLSEIQP